MLLTNTIFFSKWFTITTITVCGKAFEFSQIHHSVFTRKKIINKIFTTLFWDILFLTFYLATVISKFACSSQEVFCRNSITGVFVSTTAVKILEMYLKGVYLNSFEKPFLSNIFLSFSPICWTQIWQTRLGGCFWKVLPPFNWPKCFHFLYSTKLQ